MSVFIIAEAGVNHNGDIETAFRLIDAAIEAGADAIKFQTFNSEKLATSFADQARYQRENISKTQSQLDMLKQLELSHDEFHKLVEYCRTNNIEFLSTAFDFGSLEFLTNEIDVRKLKIPSGEITNGPFLLAHALTGKEIILSTGMATLDEVTTALGVLAFGYLRRDEKPSTKAFESVYCSDIGKQMLKEKVTLLHCTTDYPCAIADVNLRAMDTMVDAFDMSVGYSDHSEGIVIPIAAVARGAILIEKHFTLDRNLPGPDHKASLQPNELKAMINAIRDVQCALGDGVKMPRGTELNNRNVIRKSLVAAQRIKKGDVFTERNIEMKRPGTGHSPMEYWSLLGSCSPKDYESEEII